MGAYSFIAINKWMIFNYRVCKMNYFINRPKIKFLTIKCLKGRVNRES